MNLELIVGYVVIRCRPKSHPPLVLVIKSINCNSMETKKIRMKNQKSMKKKSSNYL
jgi:hypothetical protein